MYKHKPWLRFIEGTEGGNGSAPAGDSAGEQPAPNVDSQELDGGTGDSGGDAGDESKLSHEDALKELERVRREAARYRTERNQLREQSDKDGEDGKSELTEALERITALEAEKSAAEHAAVRAQVSADTGVPVEFIHGDNVEQMTEYATRLKDSMVPAGSDIPQGKLKGSPGSTGPLQKDAAAFLAEIRNKNK